VQRAVLLERHPLVGSKKSDYRGERRHDAEAFEVSQKYSGRNAHEGTGEEKVQFWGTFWDLKGWIRGTLGLVITEQKRGGKDGDSEVRS